MNYYDQIAYAAFVDELTKIAELEKDALWEKVPGVRRVIRFARSKVVDPKQVVKPSMKALQENPGLAKAVENFPADLSPTALRPGHRFPMFSGVQEMNVRAVPKAAVKRPVPTAGQGPSPHYVGQSAPAGAGTAVPGAAVRAPSAESISAAKTPVSAATPVKSKVVPLPKGKEIIYSRKALAAGNVPSRITHQSFGQGGTAYNFPVPKRGFLSRLWQ